MAKASGYGSHKASLVISGIILIIIGVLWWMGRLDINKAFALLLIGWGLKKLYWSTQKDVCY